MFESIQVVHMYTMHWRRASLLKLPADFSFEVPAEKQPERISLSFPPIRAAVPQSACTSISFCKKTFIQTNAQRVVIYLCDYG